MSLRRSVVLLVVHCSVVFGGLSPALSIAAPQQSDRKPQATSLLGKPLYAQVPSDKLLNRLKSHKEAFETEPDNVDSLIWYGRFLAYTGEYRAAIEVYSRGLKQFPDEPRLYRHRGHRFITIREFDKAVTDLEHAAKLVAGKPNQVEPDGMPNAKNIPLTTLHGNIHYHLGLAHYLQDDLDNALAAFNLCLRRRTNDDNVVSATHWIYMILRRRGNRRLARACVAPVTREMNIIENFSYHRACLFYKGQITLAEARGSDAASPADDAVRYAIGNWFLYNEQPAEARAIFQEIVDRGVWQSFGHIAAEADLARMAKASQK